MKMTHVLSSAAEDISFLIVLHMICTGELCMVFMCLSGLLLIIHQAAARERALGRTRKDEPDSQMRIISIAW